MPVYYGYIKIDFKPFISDQYPLRVFKNEMEIPNSHLEILEGPQEKFNLKIKSRTNFEQDKKHPDYQSGYIVKLKSSSAVFTNGDTIEVRYNPTAE